MKNERRLIIQLVDLVESPDFDNLSPKLKDSLGEELGEQLNRDDKGMCHLNFGWLLYLLQESRRTKE